MRTPLLVLAVALFTSAASASPMPARLHAPLAAPRAGARAKLPDEVRLALATPIGRLRVFQFTCTTTATLIRPATDPKSLVAMRIWNGVAGTGANAGTVFLGGSDVNGTTKGWPLCTASTCPENIISVDAAAVGYCIVASGTATITVFAGVGG